MSTGEYNTVIFHYEQLFPIFNKIRVQLRHILYV